jgi:predicted nucleotidyltransferase
MKTLEGSLNPKILAKFIKFLNVEERFNVKENDSIVSRYYYLCDTYKRFLSETLEFNTLYKYLAIFNLNIPELEFSIILSSISNIKDTISLFDYSLDIIEESSYDNSYIVLVKLLINYYLYHNNYSLMIFQDRVIEGLKSITCRDTKLTILKQVYDNSYAYNTTYTIKPLEEIINIITSNKEELLSIYSIDSLSIFGSYVKHKETIYSDVDLIVGGITSDTIRALEEYLSLKLDLRVSIVNEIDITRSETSIKII